MSATIIPFELHLPTILPTIEGNVDYLDLRHQLVRIDQLLLASGLETKLVELAVGRWLGSKEKPPSAKAQTNYQTHCRRALRGNIARLLLKEDFRGFAVRLADSPLLQFFCGLNELGPVRVPAKSTLQRYAAWWPETEVHAQIQQLLNIGQQQPEKLRLQIQGHLQMEFLWLLLADVEQLLGGQKQKCMPKSSNCSTSASNSQRNSICKSPWIWRRPFWTRPASKPTSIIRWIGFYFATPPAL